MAAIIKTNKQTNPTNTILRSAMATGKNNIQNAPVKKVATSRNVTMLNAYSRNVSIIGLVVKFHLDNSAKKHHVERDNHWYEERLSTNKS